MLPSTRAANVRRLIITHLEQYFRIADVQRLSYTNLLFFFFNDTATTEIYTLSLHDALPIYLRRCRVEEEIVRIQGVVAEKLVGISVIMSRAALQIHLDVASAVAARRCIIERRLRLELLDGIGIGQRHVVQDWKVYVVRVDAFQLEIVVSGTLSVDVNRHLSPAKRCGVKELRVGSGGESEKREKIPRGKWEGAGRLRANRFTGGCGGEFHGQ